MSATTQRLRFLGSELVLGALVALLSVLTALAAYQGSLADSQENDFNVRAQKQLSESNTEFLRANQDVIYDLNMYDGYYVQSKAGDAELTDYYFQSFSDSLKSAIERPEGPFDDQYYAETFAEADATYETASGLFDHARAAGDRADHMQLVMMVFAVGLALAAYGSLLNRESGLRILFAIGSLLALAFGLFSFFTA